MKKILSFALLLFFTLSANLAFAVLPPPLYEIIVDAGSTGSRLHLFRVEKPFDYFLIQDVFTENTKPGLSSYANNPSAAGTSLAQLLKDANTQLSQMKIDPHNVKVNVMATAGMRLLTADQQAAIYASVNAYLAQNTHFQIGEVDTIPGSMEGLYGWLDVNYLNQSFRKLFSKTLGSIDMGGASTQIAFETEDSSHPNNEFDLQIFGKHYRVYAISFLGLGQDQAFASMESNSNDSVCFPTGYTDSHVSPGNFNYASCENLYSNVISNQSVTQQLISTANANFIAYSGTYYDFNFFGGTPNPNPNQLASAIQNVCSESWTQLQSQYPSDKYLSGYCANGIYVSDLLFNTYQLQAGQVQVLTQIDQKGLDWTLGAMLYQLIH